MTRQSVSALPGIHSYHDAIRDSRIAVFTNKLVRSINPSTQQGGYRTDVILIRDSRTATFASKLVRAR
jgi:hypothetical protein